ncbi:hypothetical protein BS17DRAFT_798458 [Gyrodon lividus]|nr:hypothetical protein BS17DRAFT_798458 [Gyrodon lividus]
MPSEKHKPQGKPAQYNQPAKKQKTAYKVSATSAQLPVAQSTTQSNLTLSNWMTVFAYTLKSGALIFTQSTLCHKLWDCKTLEACVHDNPNALSSKCPCIQMDNKGETVRFVEKFDVLENERLPRDGWIASFCKAYGIQEHKRHGEAGSVDTDAILAKFASRDRFNFDETDFFPS